MKTRCLELFSYSQDLRGGAADAVHDARITSRRLLALYDVFKGCVNKKKLKKYKKQVKSLNRLTGKIREYDIQMGLLGKFLSAGSHPSSKAAALLHARCAVLRSVEQKQLIKMMDKLKKEDFQAKFLDAVDKVLN
jgi:CHAD domain-containing protein